MKRAFAHYWKPGALTFVIALGLCLISIWQRQVRYNLVFTFSAQPITNGIDLPSLRWVNPETIAKLLELMLEQHYLRAKVTRAGGTFTVVVESFAAQSRERVQEVLSATYQEVTERFGKDIDTTPLSAQLSALDARLDLVARTLQSTGLSAHEQYALKDQALVLAAERAGVSRQLEILAIGVFSPPTSQLYRASQMDTEVLLALSLVLSGFIACATMVLAESLRSNA